MATLRACKAHLHGRRFAAVVVDGRNVVFTAASPGWTKASRAECQAFIAAQAPAVAGGARGAAGHA